MRRFFSIIVVNLTLIAGSALAEAHGNKTAESLNQLTSFADIVEPLMPAVVNIYTVKYNKQAQSKGSSLSELFPFEQFNEFFEQFNVPFSFEELYSNPRALSLGSGFFIDNEGLIVTNHHVIAGSDEIHIKLPDNTELPVKIIGSDPKTDLALLKIDSKKKFPFVPFGDSGKARVGDIVIAIGNPLGFGGTVTTGIISSKGRDLGSGVDELVDDFIQTDAAINIGNSGGPLFNIKGEVIGVNTSIPAVNNGANIGIGFAIPSNTVQNIIGQLKANGKISRGRLDVTIQEVTKELVDALNLEKNYGVLIADVLPGGTGEKAGLKRSDLITEFNGKKVLNSRKLQLLVAEARIGEEINLTVIRDGKTINLTAKIKESEPEITPTDIPKVSTLKKSGVTFSDLSPIIINKFGLEENSKGVVIVDLPFKENNYDLRVGDLIIAINKQYINNIEQFTTIYDKIKNENKKNVVLLVKRREFTMFVAFPIK